MKLRNESPDVMDLQLGEGGFPRAFYEEPDVTRVIGKRVNREPPLVRKVLQIALQQPVRRRNAFAAGCARLPELTGRHASAFEVTQQRSRNHVSNAL